MAKKFGDLLRSLRQEKSMSQRELGGRVGVHHTYISKLERGGERVSRGMVRRLAMVLGATVSTFELAAGYVPDEFAKVIAENDDIRQLLVLAVEARLSDEGYLKLRKLLQAEGTVNVPVWLE